jgi:hypothetical protein
MTNRPMTSRPPGNAGVYRQLTDIRPMNVSGFVKKQKGFSITEFSGGGA